jgi:hypothetical protein
MRLQTWPDLASDLKGGILTPETAQCFKTRPSELIEVSG